MSQVQLTNDIQFLSVNNLCVMFIDRSQHNAKINAVQDVSFNLGEGEILSVAGESGSGKTTVARTISALASPTSGSVTFKGTEVSSLKGKDLLKYRRQVQMIFQDPYESLNPRWDVFTTVSNHIRYLTGEKNRDSIQEKVVHLVTEVGLDPGIVLHRLPHMLSGGERQRINIARALSPDPRLLIADEPVTMLDASQRLNVLRLLLKLKTDRNLSIILITHDLASAKVASDRIIIMKKGRIVEAGQTDIVLTKPSNEYTRLILSSTPDIKPVAPARQLAEK
jgi:ABC-type oligopeptide transport system ATPase subunit